MSGKQEEQRPAERDQRVAGDHHAAAVEAIGHGAAHEREAHRGEKLREPDVPEPNARCVFPGRYRPLTSIAYRFALVAAGEAVAAVSLATPSAWDLCAGHALLGAAQGVVIDQVGATSVGHQDDPRNREGGPTGFGQGTLLIATDPLTGEGTAYGWAGDRTPPEWMVATPVRIGRAVR